MKKLLFLLIISVLLPGVLVSKDKPGKQPEVLFGTAKINITPDVPTLMSGYAGRDKPFSGVHDSLYASAFYFTGEKDKALLITADVIGFPYDLVDELKGLISAKINIPQRNIMLVAVHNHGGPVVGNREPESVKLYAETLKKKLVKLADDASKNVSPFLMGAGTGSCNLNINRRAEFSKGEIWLGRNPDGPCDHDVDVIKFETPDHKLLAVLVNWPCHATTSGQNNLEITGDWPGSAARHLQEVVGKNVVIGITAGASGDINPIYGPGNDFREINAVGYHVGREAAKVITQIATVPVTSFQAIDTALVFPGKKPSADRFPKEKYEPGPDTKIQISTFKIGNLILGGISGELMNEIGMEMKKQSPYTHTTIMTHCNGSCGYICTDKSFKEGGYEIMVTRLQPGVEKPLISTFVGMVNAYK